MKYKDWLKDWLDCYVKPATKPLTHIKYRRATEKYIIPELGELELDALSAHDLQRFAADLAASGLAPNTVGGILSVLRTSLKRAVAAGLKRENCAAAMVRPRQRAGRANCLSVKDQRRLETHIKNECGTRHIGIVLCLYTGMRIGELLALTWKDVDLARGTVSVVKTCRDEWQDGKYLKVFDTPKTESSERTIPLPKQLLPRLKEAKRAPGKNSEYVVPGRSPFGAQVRTYQRMFSRLLAKLGIPHVGFHALRHTFATRALEIGMDVKTLSEILGHKSPAVTLSRYVHSLSEHKADMMNRVGSLIV